MSLVNRYMIRRFHQDGTPTEVIERGLTLAEAQAHCRDPKTSGGDSTQGNAWFDGYDLEDAEDDGQEYDDGVAFIDEAHYTGPFGQDYIPDEDIHRGDR